MILCIFKRSFEIINFVRCSRSYPSNNVNVYDIKYHNMKLCYALIFNTKIMSMSLILNQYVRRMTPTPPDSKTARSLLFRLVQPLRTRHAPITILQQRLESICWALESGMAPPERIYSSSASTGTYYLKVLSYLYTARACSSRSLLWCRQINEWQSKLYCLYLDKTRIHEWQINESVSCRRWGEDEKSVLKLKWWFHRINDDAWWISSTSCMLESYLTNSD